MRGASSTPPPVPMSAPDDRDGDRSQAGASASCIPIEGARIVGRALHPARDRHPRDAAQRSAGHRRRGPPGVTTTGALQQMVYLKDLRPFARAVVVGTELVSFSALLTARHGGIKIAAMIEEGDRIAARKPGDWIARHLFGVPVLTRTKLVGHPWQRARRGCRDRAGRQARNHRLRRRHLHRQVPAGDGAARRAVTSFSIPTATAPPSISSSAPAIPRSSPPAICCGRWRHRACAGPKAASSPRTSPLPSPARCRCRSPASPCGSRIP